MAKWLKDYLSFGGRRPPQPPQPDYTESEILKAYRLQKNLDFEDPYEDAHSRAGAERSGSADGPQGLGSPLKDGMAVSPKHRLIKMDSQDLGRAKILLSAMALEEPAEPVVPSAPVVGHTDYSDPFDVRLTARLEQVTGPTSPESSSYMEPFEAQRVASELQKRPAAGRTKAEVLLYDTPYEEERDVRWREGVEGGREGRLPQGDERPADEYDQPWEWKKEHISKAFAVQFEGGVWERGCGPRGGGRPMDPPATLGERVDPTMPLEKQAWFHGSLSRGEAEALLCLCKESSYLVRNSQTSCQYSLSLRSSRGFMHMRFSRSRDGQFVLGQNSAPFCSIPALVHHYTTHKLPITGAEHLSLLHPCPYRRSDWPTGLAQQHGQLGFSEDTAEGEGCDLLDVGVAEGGGRGPLDVAPPPAHMPPSLTD